jgi:hypothetical protein
MNNTSTLGLFFLLKIEICYLIQVYSSRTWASYDRLIINWLSILQSSLVVFKRFLVIDWRKCSCTSCIDKGSALNAIAGIRPSSVATADCDLSHVYTIHLWYLLENQTFTLNREISFLSSHLTIVSLLIVSGRDDVLNRKNKFKLNVQSILRSRITSKRQDQFNVVGEKHLQQVDLDY